MPERTERACTKCGQVKPLTEFHKLATGRDGRRSECAECARERARRAYRPEDHITGLLRLTCQFCGQEFEYVKTSGRLRAYCSQRCRYGAGEAAKKARGIKVVRACACGSTDVALVGKAVCPACRRPAGGSLEYRRRRERNRTLALYGLTEERWQELLASQGGKCAICRSTNPGNRNQGFSVDHDHRCCPGTGSCGRCVRGLLCERCNFLIGQANDDISILATAITYLQERTGEVQVAP
jgi:Recombination endonuclease VII